VPCRLIADDVDDGAARAARVVQIRQPIGQAGTTVQERACRAAGDAVVAVGHAGDDVFVKAEHTVHAGDAIERRDEMHLARAGVRETGIHTRRKQRVHQTLGAIHVDPPLRSALATAGNYRRCDDKIRKPA